MQNHVGIAVNDIEESINFYERIGFTLEQQYLLTENCHIKAAFLAFNGFIIELYQDLQAKPINTNVGNINHIAISVSSLKDMVKIIEKYDIPIIEGPKELPFGDNGMVYIVVEGPMKEKIELDEWL